MRRLPQWHHALARSVWIWFNYTVKRHAVYHSTLPFSLCRCLGEGMTRKRENLVHNIFVCAAIFKLGHLEYGANFKLEHYRVNLHPHLHINTHAHACAHTHTRTITSIALDLCVTASLSQDATAKFSSE